MLNGRYERYIGDTIYYSDASATYDHLTVRGVINFYSFLAYMDAVIVIGLKPVGLFMHEMKQKAYLRINNQLFV